MKNFQFFCDFDGTITKEDTLNKFLRVYAKTDWLEVERCYWLKTVHRRTNAAVPFDGAKNYR